MSDTPTPQTTRCAECGKPATHIHDRQRDRVRPPTGEWHKQHSHYCDEHRGLTCCSPLVPAPSAPARAGEPTTWGAKDAPALLLAASMADAEGLTAFANKLRDTALRLSRALAPATAEPTAEADAWVFRDTDGRYLPNLTVTRLLSLPYAEQKAQVEAYAKLIGQTPIPLSRGSGPVGQA